MTDSNTNPREGTDPKALIQYRNRAGAIVSIREHEQSTDPDRADFRYTAACSACLENPSTNGDGRVKLAAARSWATEHAGKCAAIPPFITLGEVDRAGYSELAAEYAKRAARLLEGKTAVYGVTAEPREARNPIESAGIYASIADVYARLAGH